MTLSEQLELVRRRELAEQWDRNEAQLATALTTCLPEKRPLDDRTKELVRPFIQWANAVDVRHLPARATTIATFIFKQFDSGVLPETILEQVGAIERLHDSFDISNPVATFPVRHAMGEIITAIEVPRSWTKEQQAEFKTFPIQAQKIILLREKNRETHLRQKQNELADLKKALRLQAAAASTSADTTTEKETT